MAKYFKISIIGSGNLAWHLALALENKGHSIFEVYSRNIKNAEKLCAKLYEARATDRLNFQGSHAEIFIIAVSDKAIPAIVESAVFPRAALVVHTSGTVSLEVLEGLSNPIGVFYPIQTFTKNHPIDFNEVYISLEFVDKKVGEVLKSLAHSFTKRIDIHTTEQRRVIHLSGVFAANFSNHMFTVAKGLLESNKLNFELIKPLILEMVNKAMSLGPEKAQTGPAIRNDCDTIEKHLEYLSEEKKLTKIYKAITKDIINTYED